MDEYKTSALRAEQRAAGRERALLDACDFEGLERVYWKNLTYAPPLYGADSPGTLFDDSMTAWNLK